jgi:hypothetical protein
MVDALIYSGCYVDVYLRTGWQQEDIVLRPTALLKSEYRDPVKHDDYGLVFKNESNINNPCMLHDLLEDWLCNSDYDLVDSSSTGDLISESCPIILKDAELDDDYDLVNFSDKWWFSQYQVRNEYYDLYQGALHLDKA